MKSVVVEPFRVLNCVSHTDTQTTHKITENVQQYYISVNFLFKFCFFFNRDDHLHHSPFDLC